MGRAKEQQDGLDTDRLRQEIDGLRRQVRELSGQLGTARDTIAHLSNRLQASTGIPKGSEATEDVRALARPVLRHRVITTFNAEAAGLRPDDVIGRLLEALPAERQGLA